MAEITEKMINHHLLGGSRLMFTTLSQSLPSILPFHFSWPFSTLAEKNGTAIAHLRNPFAHFAATKFNMSSADIARMFKSAPPMQRLQTLEKVEEFVDMLSKRGFEPHQIAIIMRRLPAVVLTGVSFLKPKLKLLEDYGVGKEHLQKILTGLPKILKVSLEQELIPKMPLLQNAFQSQDLLIKALVRCPSILTYNMYKILQPSLAFWKEFGFGEMDLAKFLCTRPSLLRCASFTPAQVDLIQKVGIDRGSKNYKHVLAVIAGLRPESLELKILNFQQCGLSNEETMELFRVNPYIFHFSVEKIRHNMEFMVNNMELPANSVVSLTMFLQANLEKVMRPRFVVLQEMKYMNGFANLEPKQLCAILRMPEAKFRSKIIEGHPESSTLYGIYEKAMVYVSTKISRKVRYF